MVMKTVVLLTKGKGIAHNSKRIVNRCMLLCKYITYINVRCITLNLEWLGEV